MPGGVEVDFVFDSVALGAGHTFTNLRGAAQRVGGGIAEFLNHTGCGVQQQAPAGLATAFPHALFGRLGFGLGLGAFGGQPQLEGQCGQFGLFIGEIAGMLERCGRVGEQVIEFGSVPV